MIRNKRTIVNDTEMLVRVNVWAWLDKWPWVVNSSAWQCFVYQGPFLWYTATNVCRQKVMLKICCFVHFGLPMIRIWLSIGDVVKVIPHLFIIISKEASFFLHDKFRCLSYLNIIPHILVLFSMGMLSTLFRFLSRHEHLYNLFLFQHWHIATAPYKACSFPAILLTWIVILLTEKKH